MASTCQACGKEIVFVGTENGSLMPCNPRGITIITPDGRTVRGRETHFASCPGARKLKQWDNPARTLFN